MDDRVADGLAEDVGGRVQAARHDAARAVGRRAPSASAATMASVAAPAGMALSASGPSPCARPSAISPPDDGDGAQEDRVEDDQEAEQRARRAARAQPGAPQRPERHRRAADAGGRQQPRRGGPAERHLRALAQSEARGRAAADQPEQGDVAGEGEQLEDGAADDPARIGIERAAQRVSEGVQRTARHDDRRRGRGRQPGGHGGAARERAHVDGRDGEVGVGLAEGGHQDYCRAARPSVSLGLLTSRCPERMHTGPDTTTRVSGRPRGPHSGAIHRPGVRRAAPRRPRISAERDPLLDAWVGAP